MHTKRRTALLLILIPSVLAVGLCGFTYREVRQTQLNHALIAAIRGDRTAEALSLLDRGADPNARAPANDPQPFWRIVLDNLIGRRPPSHSMTALFLSVTRPDHAKLVAVLLKHGADPNAEIEGDLRPLVFAALMDDARGTMVQGLLERGAKVNVDSIGKTPLIAGIMPGNLAVMKLLVAHGANVEVPDDLGNPPLHLAAYGYQRVQKVQFLLDHHANVNSRDRAGHTLLYSLYHDKINDHRAFAEVIRRLKRAGATE